jgi:hypothetical protein
VECNTYPSRILEWIVLHFVSLGFFLVSSMWRRWDVCCVRFMFRGRCGSIHSQHLLCCNWGSHCCGWRVDIIPSNMGPPLWSSGQRSWLQNGDVLFFLWGTNWIYICYVEESRPPLWSSGQRSWLQNADVLFFLWGTNWIYICYVEESRPPLRSSGQSSWLQNADVLWFLWGTNWIYICYVEESGPPLWSRGQSF